MMALTFLILISLSVKKDIFEDVSVSSIRWRHLKLSLIVSSMGSYEMPFLLYVAQPQAMSFTPCLITNSGFHITKTRKSLVAKNAEAHIYIHLSGVFPRFDRFTLIDTSTKSSCLLYRPLPFPVTMRQGSLACSRGQMPLQTQSEVGFEAGSATED